ncbi:PAS domain-containing protein [Allomuricauda sp. SCSIO 65647]|uniref:PAS domain-containing protein n=1 Tax=Allomuricauda sp. SCSIO 65647 TaxID=2908843 RepID=UPI001F23BF28|nr:PAS domain-containing protein [Muricauda sp. SCSIO 65647]UJH69224.1 PAS domain-containing protein [Muricauda sp. SCSIO 65647]
MKEFEVYDSAAQRFYDTLTIKSPPLASWDFYAMHFDTICNNYLDISLLKNIAKRNKWSASQPFEDHLLNDGLVIVVTDAQLRIVHATHNIFSMTGYSPEEILGKRPKIFQGKDTCQKTSKRIGEAIKKREPFEETILNYRKDGSTYNCRILAEPIYNTSGDVINFIAYEKEVA